MRFARLNLLAFGHFTDVAIDLGETPALHLVYGPNEAGKSTALRAITGLLYGIPATTTDAHLHKMSEMRVGAVLAHDGTSLAVVRRKGNVNTLLDADGREPISELALRSLLGGVDESTFRAMFGLDHVTLRQGAEALLSGGGSVGESLFDAGVSGRGIQRVLDELRAEADQLYRPRGQRQAINEALRRFKEAKERRTSDSVRPDAWVMQVDDLERARRESREASERQRALVAERNALQRALRVLPLLTKRRGLVERREALGEVVALAPEAAAQRIEVQRELGELDRDARRLRGEIAALESQVAEIEVPDVLARLDPERVEEIRDRLGEHRKALVDLPKRTAERKVREGEVERLAATVGLGDGAADLERVRLGVRAQAAVRRLATRRAALDASGGDLRRRLADREAELDAARARLANLSTPPDGAALSAALDAASVVADLPERIERLDADISVLEGASAAALARLAPWDGTAEALGRLALPSPETVARCGRELDGLEAAALDLARRRGAIEQRIADNREQQRAQEEIGAPPSEADLLEARARRDASWRDIAASGRGVSKTDADAFGQAVARADEIADRLRREAGRVAAAASLRAEAERLDAEMSGLAREREELDGRQREWRARWTALWDGVGFEPRGPAEMRDWLARVAEAIECAARLRELEGERQRLRGRVEQRCESLAALLREHGGEVRDGEQLEALLRCGRDLCDRWQSQRREREDAAKVVQSLEAEIGRERRAVAERDDDLASWRREWGEAVGALGLSGDVSTEEALAVLEGTLALAAKIEDAAAIRARVAAIEIDVEAFRRDVAKLVGEAAPQLAELEPVEAAERLIQLHGRAVSDLERRTRLEESAAAKRDELGEIEQHRETAAGALQSLFAAAGVADVEALQAAERRSAEAASIDEDLREVEIQLLDAGEGAGVAELIEQTDGIDVDGARARLFELEGEIETLREEIDGLLVEIGSKERGLAVLENERGAAAAAAEEQESLADLAERVRRYVRVKLAAEILEAEVERYRQQNQGPILTKANVYFPRLTLGRYSELRVGFDAKDQEVLRCVRDDGTEVDIEALSDGTRDQLYLALRLATIEHFAEGHDPLPLVLDDVFIHFDDDRARSALEVLGTFAETTQILFFTHHARLLELAREVVPDGRRIEHDLSKLRAPAAADAQE